MDGGREGGVFNARLGQAGRKLKSTQVGVPERGNREINILEREKPFPGMKI